MLLSIKNLKQKQFNKKLSYKFIKSFRMKDKINEQAYRLTLLNIYCIYNTFHVLFLKLYLYRAGDSKAKTIMQASKFIDDTKQ